MLEKMRMVIIHVAAKTNVTHAMTQTKHLLLLSKRALENYQRTATATVTTNWSVRHLHQLAARDWWQRA
jgi:hypothetical protein